MLETSDFVKSLIKAHKNGTLAEEVITKDHYFEPKTLTRKENKINDKQLAKDSGLFGRYSYVG